MWVSVLYHSLQSTTPNRCRERSSCHGQFFDPLTFGETPSGLAEGVSAVTEDGEDDTDEVAPWFSSTRGLILSFSDSQIIGVSD